MNASQYQKSIEYNESVQQNIHIIVDNTVPDWNDLDIPVLIQIQILIYRMTGIPSFAYILNI